MQKSFDSREAAIDIINVFAKHKLSIDTLEMVFDSVRLLLKHQTILEYDNYIGIKSEPESAFDDV